MIISLISTNSIGDESALETEALKELDLHLRPSDSNGTNGVCADGINHVLELLKKGCQ